MRNLRTLSWTRTTKLGMAAVMVAVFGLAMVPQAQATPITFYNDASSTTDARFTLGCGSVDGDCAGLLAALISASPTYYDSTNSLVGQMFDLGNSGDATVLAFVNANIVGGNSFTSGTKDESGNIIFTTSADYFLIKTGNKSGLSNALVHNLSGGSLTLYFTAFSGSGTGLSHIVEFGNESVTVPEPATLGMFGTGVLLIGLFMGLRRRYR